MFLGLPVDANFGEIPPIIVPSRRVVVFDPHRRAVRRNGARRAPCRRLLDAGRPVDRRRTGPDATSGRLRGHHRWSLGAPPRQDGFVATQWHLGIGPSEPTTDALVVYNVDNVDGTSRSRRVGPGGPTPIDGLTDIPIGPGAVITIDLESPDALNRN